MWNIENSPRRFSILVLCGAIYPENVGGAEVHLFYKCSMLAKRGHHISVVSSAPKLSDEASDSGTTFAKISLRLLPRPFTRLSYVVKSIIASLKLKKQIEMVHAHTASIFVMMPAFLFSLLKRKPYIVVCVGSDIRMSSRKFLLRALQLPFLHHAKSIVTVSNEMTELLIQKYSIPKRKILTVGNAYDDRITQKLTNTMLCAEAKRSKRIISVANMRPVKDHMTLLKGFAKLNNNMNNVQLSLVGEGVLRGQLEGFCVQHNLHSVRFLGRLPHEDVLEHIANSDIFVLTSVEEGMPTVILEALALGKPVISTAVGGIPEVVKEGVNGILIPPKSPEHVAKALERLLRDSELRRKLGKAAAESVKDYRWSKIIEKYENLYRALLSSGRD